MNWSKYIALIWISKQAGYISVNLQLTWLSRNFYLSVQSGHPLLKAWNNEVHLNFNLYAMAMQAENMRSPLPKYKLLNNYLECEIIHFYKDRF